MDIEFYNYIVKRMKKQGTGSAPAADFLTLVRDKARAVKVVLVNTGLLEAELNAYKKSSGRQIVCDLPADAGDLVDNLTLDFAAEIAELPPKKSKRRVSC